MPERIHQDERGPEREKRAPNHPAGDARTPQGRRLRALAEPRILPRTFDAESAILF